MDAEFTRTITFETPDSVVLEYRPAGILLRFAALFIDELIQLVAYVLLGVAWAIVEYQYRLSGTVTMALMIALGSFLLLGGYFIIFEYAWQGQTPGKRLARVRVIRVGGYPLTLREAVLRNVFRLLDVLPGNAAVGIASIFLSKFQQRVGDLASGTVVVAEPRVGTGSLPAEVAMPSSTAGREHGDARGLAVEFLGRREELAPAERNRLSERLVAFLGLVSSDSPAERELALSEFVRTPTGWQR